MNHQPGKSLRKKIDIYMKPFTTEIRRDIIKNREQKNKETLENVRSVMTREQCRVNDLAQMKGSSSWLTTLPLESEYFTLNKREFF